MTCGFRMPNPATSGLPNPANYDTSVAGVVLDKVTGLAWQRTLDTNLYSPTDAAAYCAATRLDGRTDWRVPTVLELTTLVDYTQQQLDPDIDPVAFPNTPNDNTITARFVTSTPVAGDASLNWFVHFQNGNSTREAAGAGRIRCVRVGDPSVMRCYPSNARFSPAAGTVGTVLDAATGLVWQQGVSPAGMQWADAVTYCAGLSGGFRLPSMKEMQTIVSYTVAAPGPMIDGVFASSSISPPYYWTGSPLSGVATSAWLMDFGTGISSWNGRTATYPARCVRAP